jgi:hypothetical protein
MNKRLEILVEERSMEAFLRNLIPKLLPNNFTVDHNCFIYPHQGKTDLQKRLANRLKAYKSYPDDVIIIIIQDQDSSDCVLLKNKLIELIEKNNSTIDYLVRIACRELENWYLGDLDAVESIYPKSKASRKKNKAKFRVPDLLNGSEEMRKFSNSFTKVACAKKMGKQIKVDTNKSKSFGHFVSGLQKLLEQ